jgi:hypothetical protein
MSTVLPSTLPWAVQQACIRRQAGLACQVPRRGGRQAGPAGHGRTLERTLQGGLEIQVARLEIGCVGVGDIGSQHLLALVAYAQRLGVEVQHVIQPVQHGRHLVSLPPELQSLFAMTAS